MIPHDSRGHSPKAWAGRDLGRIYRVSNSLPAASSSTTARAASKAGADSRFSPNHVPTRAPRTTASASQGSSVGNVDHVTWVATSATIELTSMNGAEMPAVCRGPAQPESNTIRGEEDAAAGAGEAREQSNRGANGHGRADRDPRTAAGLVDAAPQRPPEQHQGREHQCSGCHQVVGVIRELPAAADRCQRNGAQQERPEVAPGEIPGACEPEHRDRCDHDVECERRGTHRRWRHAHQRHHREVSRGAGVADAGVQRCDDEKCRAQQQQGFRRHWSSCLWSVRHVEPAAVAASKCRRIRPRPKRLCCAGRCRPV